jgi:hypothetical protein
MKEIVAKVNLASSILHLKSEKDSTNDLFKSFLSVWNLIYIIIQVSVVFTYHRFIMIIGRQGEL